MQSQCGHAVILGSTGFVADDLLGSIETLGSMGFVADDLLGSTVTLGSMGFVGDEDLLTLQETCCPHL